MSSLLRCSAEGFSALEANLAERLAEQMRYTVKSAPSPSERRSWQRSLPVLATDLRDAGLGHVEMLIEYRLPLVSKRADVVLAGVHPSSGEPSYLVVELKQWSRAALYQDDPHLVEVDGIGRAVSHPVDQVDDYVEYLTQFTASLAAVPESIHGVAYLHNATEAGVAGLWKHPGASSGRLITSDRRGEFQRLLRRTFSSASGVGAADLLQSSDIKPSRQLMTVAAEEVQEREMFTLLDEQRDAFNHVRHVVDQAKRSDSKTAVIITGGPGTGKSVIALSLMGELMRRGTTVVHATGSQSFTQTLRKVAGARKPVVKKMFQYFNSFMAAEPNSLECVILDEAHRIRETSANRFTRKEHRTGRRQIDELLSVARTPVFLLDQYQVVRPGELGTVAEISQAALTRGIDVVQVDLDDQFRCGGSQAYVNWVESLLGLSAVAEHPWPGDDAFDVQLADSPAQLTAWMDSRLASGYGARLTAGYCWRWSNPRPDSTLVPDVRIGSWSRPWNVKSDRRVGDAPPSQLWASEAGGEGQVGCIYTAQGFEFDYAGVIIGPDLIYRRGEWITDRAANRDPAFRNSNAVPDEQFDELVRHVYKVLLTRGMRGVAIFSTDAETQDQLARLVSARISPQ